MIYTVTLNPCIDKALIVNKLELNELNRAVSSRTDASGKGINVSITLSVLDTKSIALGFMGAPNKQLYDETLQNYNVESDFVYINSSTRTNTKIIDLFTNKQTDVSESGFPVEEFQKEQLFLMLSKYIDSSSIVDFSGSMPKNFSHSDYRKLVELALSKGAKVIIDSEKENLSLAIEKKVLLIKPNQYEFENYLGVEFTNKKDIANAALEMCKSGVENVIVSLGKDGCIFATKENVFYSKTLDVPVKSITGAGDSVVAAFISGYSKNLPYEDIIKLCMATSNACVMTDGSLPAEKDTINELIKKIEIEKII